MTSAVSGPPVFDPKLGIVSKSPDTLSGVGASGDERGAWLRLRPELAARVELRSELGTQFAWVRNLSPRGVLLQVAQAPLLGSWVEVTFPGIERSLSAAHPLALEGYIQHALAWSVASGPYRLIAVRFATSDTSDSRTASTAP